MKKLRFLSALIPHFLLLGAIIWYGTSFSDGVTDVMGEGSLWENSILQPRGGEFFDSIRSIVLELLDAIKIAVNGIALLALAYVWYLWVSSMGDEEKQNDGKYRLLLIFIGLFLINIPEILYTIITGSSYLDDNFWRKVQTVSTRDPGPYFTESSLNDCNFFFCTQNFWGNSSVIAVMKFFEVIMIAAAVVMFTWWGFTMLFRWNNEDRSDRGKMRLIYGSVALIIVGFVEALYRSVFFGGALDAGGIMETLITIGNFGLFLAGPIAIIFIIIGAYYYITAGGNEESADRGKRIILYTFMATILVILAYTILVELTNINLT